MKLISTILTSKTPNFIVNRLSVFKGAKIELNDGAFLDVAFDRSRTFFYTRVQTTDGVFYNAKPDLIEMTYGKVAQVGVASLDMIRKGGPSFMSVYVRLNSRFMKKYNKKPFVSVEYKDFCYCMRRACGSLFKTDKITKETLEEMNKQYGHNIPYLR